MALIKCPECGKEISDTSTQCVNCGAPLKTEQSKSKAKKNGKMFSGFLLNIFSVVIPAILIFGINSLPEHESSGGTTIEFSADYSASMLLFIVIVGLVIFAIGLAIYFIKNAKLQKTLSIVYLIAAIVALCLLIANTLTYLMATCGLGILLYVPGILQIIAGIKYISAVRENEA